MAKAKLRHVAVCTEDPAATAAWYQEVFGLEEVGRTHSGGVYLSDGDINLAVLKVRDTGDPSITRPGVSHYGFVVEDPQATYEKLDLLGTTRLPTVPLGNQYFEVKYVDPENQIFDVGEHGWVGGSMLEPASGPARPAKIRHVAISTDDVEKTAAWYQEIFGLEEVGKSPSGVYLSDGETNFAVLRIKDKNDPSRIERGMHHFGFMVADPEATRAKLAALGSQRLPDIAIGNQYFEEKYVAPDGVTVDLGVHGWVGALGVEPVAGTAGAH
jgi:catechol 2,3-dioxygenase-like lactoylglutathione lyase family enzyme